MKKVKVHYLVKKNYSKGITLSIYRFQSLSEIINLSTTVQVIVTKPPSSVEIGGRVLSLTQF